MIMIITYKQKRGIRLRHYSISSPTMRCCNGLSVNQVLLQLWQNEATFIDFENSNLTNFKTVAEGVPLELGTGAI